MPSCEALAPPSASSACCGTDGGATHLGLLAALGWLQDAPVTDLLRDGAVANVVRQVGLTPTTKKARMHGHAKYGHSMWGEEAVHQVNISGRHGRDNSGPSVGMWQVPRQFECLVQALAAAGDVRRSMCIGTWSGWTDVVRTRLWLFWLHPLHHRVRRLSQAAFTGGRYSPRSSAASRPRTARPRGPPPTRPSTFRTAPRRA